MSAEPSKGQFVILRIIALLLGLPLTVFAFLVLRTQFATSKFNLIACGMVFGLMLPAALCWWFVIRGHIAKSRNLMLSTLVGGVAVGGLGFIIGFVGPIIFTPHSNQGPLLGVFVTGPIGVCVGALIGFCVGFVRMRGVKTATQ